MSFPRYPAYKPSGVEWLGEVPLDWNLVQVRRLGPLVESGTSVNSLDNQPSGDKPAVLKTSCVYTGIFRKEECKEIVKDEIVRASCPVKKNSLIVSRMNTPDLVGAAGLTDSDVDNLFLPDRLWQVRLAKAVSSYAYYWTQSSLYRGQVKATCSGTSSSMQNLSQENFFSFYLALPDQVYQAHIATFLDHETAKIDALIAEQQRLIELLHEKRQAVISHTVTKGLNPDAPMKDSGVEWLGKVPEHWEIMPLKRIVAMQSGNQITSERIESAGLYPVYGGNGLRGYTSSFTHSGEFVLVGRQGALCGNINYSTGKFFASEHAVVATPRKTIDVSWLGEMMRTMNLNQYSVSAAQPGLSVELISNIKTIYVPVEEQRILASFLNDQDQALSGLSTEAIKTIDLLQERRSTLISAAVTGQIDVRGYAPEAAVA